MNLKMNWCGKREKARSARQIWDLELLQLEESRSNESEKEKTVLSSYETEFIQILGQWAHGQKTKQKGQ